MAKSNIQFYNEDVVFKLTHPTKIKDWLKQTITKELCSPGDISFIFCSDNYLLNINKKYLNHDYYTDIITFDYRENDVISGDLFLSIDRIKENAANSSLDFMDEVHRVMIHGVLHIIGFNDKTPEEESIMRSKEDFYLSLRSI